MNRPGQLFLCALAGTALVLALFSPGPAQEKPADADALPAGASKRFGTTRLRHGSRVLCLAFAPNGKRLAAGGGNDPVRIWDTETGQEILHLKETWVQALAFAPPRGAVLVSAGAFKKIRAWEVVSGKEDKTLEPQTPVKALVISTSSDGGLVVSGGQDGKVTLWEYPSYKKLAILEDHKEEITALALSPDSSRLASASGDRTIRLWNTETFKQIHQLDAACYPTSLAFSGDGKTLISGGDDNLVRLWETGSGQALPPLTGHQGPVVSLVMARDGKTLVSGGQDGTIRLWDFASRKESKVIHREPGDGDALALSIDGKLLATAGLNNTVRIFETDTGKELFANLGPRGALTAAVLSRDGKTLAAGGGTRLIHLWDAQSGKELRQLPAEHHGDLTLALAPDGKTLAVAGGPAAITFWNLADGAKGPAIDNPAKDPILCVRYSPDGKQLAAGHRTGMVRVWNLADSKIVQELKYPGAAFTLAFSPDGKNLAVSGNSKVLIWEIASAREIRQFLSKDGPPATQPYVASLAYSADGNTLALGCYDAVARLVDVNSGKEVRACEGHRSAILGVAFSTDGRTLASASFDQTVRIWESFSGQQIASYSGHRGPVHAVSFSPNDRTLYSASADTSILAWEVTGLGKDGNLPALAMAPVELLTAWTELASEDTPRGHRILWRLAAAAADSVPFLGNQLYLVDPKNIDQLFADLNNDKYEVRTKATQELAKYGMWMKGRLDEAMKTPPSEEVRRRVEQLLNKLNTPGALPLQQERLRVHRVMLIMEQTATPAAQDVLQKLARGAPEPHLQLAAQQALERLRGRMGKE